MLVQCERGMHLKHPQALQPRNPRTPCETFLLLLRLLLLLLATNVALLEVSRVARVLKEKQPMGTGLSCGGTRRTPSSHRLQIWGGNTSNVNNNHTHMYWHEEFVHLYQQHKLLIAWIRQYRATVIIWGLFYEVMTIIMEMLNKSMGDVDWGMYSLWNQKLILCFYMIHIRYKVK